MDTRGYSRPPWAERRPVRYANGYENVNEGPHGQAAVAQDTVPTGRRAWIASMWIEVTRHSVYTTLGECWAEIDPGQGTMLQCRIVANTVGAQSHWGFTDAGFIEEGQTIMAVTVDADVGGTVDYHLNYQLVYYDK